MIIVTARRREERLIDVPIAVSLPFRGEQLAQRGALDITDIAQSAPNVTLEASPRDQFDAHRLHPRRRPAGPGFGLRAGRRHLSRRRLSQPSAGRRARYLRCRAHRGAARAAGHALRTQHHRRRGQIRDPPAAAGIRAQGARDIRHLRPAEGVVTASAPVGDLVRVGGSVARLSRDGFGDEPHHRPGKL